MHFVPRWLRVATVAGLIAAACTQQAPSSRPASATSLPSCRLPIARFDYGAGFVRFPSGKFEVARGVHFSKTFTFVAELNRWLPVPPAFVSRDGTSYAISTGNSVQIVDARTGRTTRVISGAFNIVELTGDGLLLSKSYADESPSLWIVPVGAEARLLEITGALPTLASNKFVPAGTTVWTQSRDGTQVVRIDLDRKVGSVWLTETGRLTILGLDGAGNLILWVYGDPPRLVTLTAQGQTTILATAVPGFSPTSAMADAHGIWFGNGVQDGSVWLYRPSAGLKKVADVPPDPRAGTSDHSTRIAGPCG